MSARESANIEALESRQRDRSPSGTIESVPKSKAHTRTRIVRVTRESLRVKDTRQRHTRGKHIFRVFDGIFNRQRRAQRGKADSPATSHSRVSNASSFADGGADSIPHSGAFGDSPFTARACASLSPSLSLKPHNKQIRTVFSKLRNTPA